MILESQRRARMQPTRNRKNHSPPLRSRIRRARTPTDDVLGGINACQGSINGRYGNRPQRLSQRPCGDGLAKNSAYARKEFRIGRMMRMPVCLPVRTEGRCLHRGRARPPVVRPRRPDPRLPLRVLPQVKPQLSSLSTLVPCLRFPTWAMRSFRTTMFAVNPFTSGEFVN